MKFDSAAEFARDFQTPISDELVDESPPEQVVFAADDGTADRFVRRLGGTLSSESVDLAHLPVGSFLLSLYSSVAGRGSGRDRVELSKGAMVDIARSGFLDLPDGQGDRVDVGRAMSQAISFFDGCTSPDEWEMRAETLYARVVNDVGRLGPKLSTSNDQQRIEAAVRNPLRMVPWSDLSVEEATAVRDSVRVTASLLRAIAGRERTRMRDQWAFIQPRLQRGMAALAREEREEVEAKLRGFSVGLDEEVDVSGLVDVVQMLLSREADLPLTGSDEEADEPDHVVGKLRNLDAFGFHKSEKDLHLANLHAGAFPRKVRSIGWPFRLQDLDTAGGTSARVSRDILQAREQYATLGDLYLLWLALDGVASGKTVTLSWVAKVGDQILNPSPILGLLSVPDDVVPAIAAQIGGLPTDRTSAPSEREATMARPTASGPSSSSVASDRLNPVASATAIACPRRYAIQWLMGPTASFDPAHLRSMLYGNVAGELQRQGWSEVEAMAVCDDLWSNLSEAERLSSRMKRRVYLGSKTPMTWMWFLGANSRDTRPLDKAYKAARDGSTPSIDVIAPPGTEFLPAGISDPAQCEWCPVSGRCKDRQSRRD